MLRPILLETGYKDEEIRRIMQAVLDRTEAIKHRRFGHLMRMPKQRWPASSLMDPSGQKEVGTT
jgi:hypothetical protein